MVPEPEDVVRVDATADPAVWRITLDRPDKLNALNEAIRAGLRDAFDDVAARDEVRVVVLAGAGRAFSAGADLREPALGTAADPGSSGTSGDAAGAGAGASLTASGDAGRGVLAQRRLSGRWQRLLDDLERLPQVTVAQLHGHVIGGAALLAAACDLRVAAEDVSIAIPELAIGIPLTWAGIPRLAREIGLPRTRELVMTGRRLGAAEAHAWGFVHRVAPTEDLASAVDALAAELVAQPVAALAMTVDALRALGRAVSAADTAWADPDLLRWSLADLRQRPPGNH